MTSTPLSCPQKNSAMRLVPSRPRQLLWLRIAVLAMQLNCMFGLEGKWGGLLYYRYIFCWVLSPDNRRCLPRPRHRPCTLARPHYMRQQRQQLYIRRHEDKHKPTKRQFQRDRRMRCVVETNQTPRGRKQVPSFSAQHTSAPGTKPVLKV